MTLLLAYAVTLIVAVLISALARRTVLSTAVLFLVAGFILGDGALGVVHLTPSDPLVSDLAELALFAVLFTDGMRLGWSDLRSAWRLPGRALGWGMPLSLALMGVLAHVLVGLPWPEAFLLGAVLAPTDPVFAAALVGNERVPHRLRHLLNVESGVNDGLALPFVIILLQLARGSGDLHVGELVLEIVFGIAIGAGIAWVAIRLERTPIFSAAERYRAINIVAIAVLVYSLAQTVHANLFLGAFAAGMAVATFGEAERDAFHEFGDLVTELLKLGALLVFGSLISPSFLADISWTGWLFAVLVLLAVRPVALSISFLWSGLGAREQIAASWFGPKGFASVVYGLLVLNSGIDAADQIFHLVAATVMLSILAHSSTDVVIADQLSRRDIPEETRRS